MGWTVYILRCGDGTLYTGCTNDLPRRLEAHRSGRGAKYTRSRLPVELVYRENTADKSAALRREAAIKRLDRRKKLALIGEKEGLDGDSAAAGDGQPPDNQPDL
ncbi:GIY-YIG nuclease family protein [Oscillospiraceae bacterium 38-13]